MARSDKVFEDLTNRTSIDHSNMVDSNGGSGTKVHKIGHPLYLQSSDHPGMALVSAHLTGSNYMSRSISVRIALGAKSKVFYGRKFF